MHNHLHLPLVKIHALMLSIAYNSSTFPRNEQEKFVCTRCLKFNHFDLESALKDDNRARVKVENLGLSLEDEGIEFEDEEDHTVIPSPTSSPSATSLEANPIPSNIPTDSTPYPPLNPQPGSSKRVKKVAAARRKRASAAQHRQAHGELKQHAIRVVLDVIRVAPDATPLKLELFDTSSLPSFSPPHQYPDNTVHGWCADTPLAKLVLWDLRVPICFPPGSTILFPLAIIMHSTLPIQKYSSSGLFR
ncbi:hypothetical protein C8J55DRAFT_485975 [Lentinula edodes]|uniref:Uncharacterized protein n=1 Tax=Lentinula lateritia TaxID=40482 RepID=A0A9W9DYD9_9AGAR|nr:hypothetical protein C8J55DRAFT_485975 [Lentinula edodes]